MDASMGRIIACVISFLALVSSGVRALGDRNAILSSAISRIEPWAALGDDEPSKGYSGIYDLSIVGLHYHVRLFYFMIPGRKEFWVKSKGSKGTGVDLPWCGPYLYELHDNAEGTFDIISGPIPPCAEETEKAHPVRNMNRTWDPVTNVIHQKMEVYIAWPIGWKALQADCNACDDPECICDSPECAAAAAISSNGSSFIHGDDWQRQQ